MVNYYEISKELDDVYLEDSFVLDIVEDLNSVIFEMEFVLREQHPLYEPPEPNKQYCYKKGKLIFPDVKCVEWKNKSFKAIEDAEGVIVYGNIDSFTYDDEKYYVEGEWGEIIIESEMPKIVLF